MIGNVSRNGISAYTQIAGMGGYGLVWVQSRIRLGTLFPILKKFDICLEPQSLEWNILH